MRCHAVPCGAMRCHVRRRAHRERAPHAAQPMQQPISCSSSSGVAMSHHPVRSAAAGVASPSAISDWADAPWQHARSGSRRRAGAR
eukprot:7387446-Prymnesium_polylepis.1